LRSGCLGPCCKDRGADRFKRLATAKVPPTAFSGNGGGRFPSSVMPGPDPGIHLSKKMDYRVFITKTRFAL